MVVSKVKPQEFHKPKLTVDAWELIHNKDGEMNENYQGKVDMKEEDSLMYLGFMLSKMVITCKIYSTKETSVLELKRKY